MTTLLTVDWDYFIDEDPMWDLGHKESVTHLDLIWRARGNLIGKMHTTGVEKSFWKKLPVTTDCPVFVSDSHCFAYEFAKQVDHVLLVDRHHDCWPAEKNRIECDTWLGEWLRRRAKRKVTWLRPKNAKMIYEVPKVFDTRFIVTDDIMTIQPYVAEIVHICRSGCWCPPWLDIDFVNFLKDLRPLKDVVSIPQEAKDTKWNPIKFRWSLEEFKQAREAAKVIEVGKKEDLDVDRRIAP
jgi:hypothetical protein